IVAVQEDKKGLEDIIQFLTERNKELENLVSKGRPPTEEVDQLRKELRSALADLARIPTTLSKSDQKMLELQLSAMNRLNDMGQAELVSSISQEFRQPLSSILGYTDLLLGESAGIIGAMQRKFLERVKASTERLGMLMTELVQVLAIDEGTFDQTPTSVEVEWVIERAVSSLSAQLKEKSITVTLDIPEELPAIQANRDALEQIIINLLQNACLVTPEDGKIQLSARTEQKDGSPQYLLIAVEDQGGGIEQEDIPRVFARRYKMENPLIQGIGDTGVSLSIVKSLVELSRGRVWVDINEGVGSTFTVLLPLQAAASQPAIDQSDTIPPSTE
ncbi:MAG: sensor histidine kinase, partial [Acidobacteriaceae bacterium]